MHQPLPTPKCRPALPSDGGLLARGFVYRTAEKTDVRLTWKRARAQLERFCARPGDGLDVPAINQPG